MHEGIQFMVCIIYLCRGGQQEPYDHVALLPGLREHFLCGQEIVGDWKFLYKLHVDASGREERS